MGTELPVPLDFFLTGAALVDKTVKGFELLEERCFLRALPCALMLLLVVAHLLPPLLRPGQRLWCWQLTAVCPLYKADDSSARMSTTHRKDTSYHLVRTAAVPGYSPLQDTLIRLASWLHLQYVETYRYGYFIRCPEKAE
jgi:hypothetical protein